MAPSETNNPERRAFDALPTGTPPPGLDTRISAQARDAVRPRQTRRLIQLTGSVAVLALTVFLLRPLWHHAPDTPSIRAPVSADLHDTADAAEEAPTQAVAQIERSNTAAAAVADTRNRTFSANKTLGASSGAETARVFSQMAKSREPQSASRVAGSSGDTTGQQTVAAAVWWDQIQTLVDHGHLDKARREYRLLRLQHPNFTPPDDTATTTVEALGHPATQ